ncbi:MAG TPA: hypothetical protein VM120_27240 [Bryobacteraceae bacterium]|nr:hypothetical protein [Bryobacteraceae bacterium]
MPEATSQARLDANRINAAKSTGPKTDRGKASSAQNGVKHGLSCRRLIVRPDEKEDSAPSSPNSFKASSPKEELRSPSSIK